MKAVLVPGFIACGSCGWSMQHLRSAAKGVADPAGRIACANPECKEHGAAYKNPVQYVELVKAEE